MFDLIISASNSERMDAFAVHRAAQFMKDLSIFTQSRDMELVIGCYNGKRELSVYVRNAVISTHNLKSILEKYSQQSCLVLWPKAEVAEEFSVTGASRLLKQKIQTSDVLQGGNGTFFPQSNQWVSYNEAL